MFQFTGLAATRLWIQRELIREPRDQHSFVNSPGLIADFHALHRLLTPRHPPYALSSLTTRIQNSPCAHHYQQRSLSELARQSALPPPDDHRAHVLAVTPVPNVSRRCRPRASARTEDAYYRYNQIVNELHDTLTGVPFRPNGQKPRPRTCELARLRAQFAQESGLCSFSFRCRKTECSDRTFRCQPDPQRFVKKLPCSRSPHHHFSCH
jgi:hypothetical protein